MATSIKTKLSVKAKDGVVTLTTRDGAGELVAQMRLTPDAAIARALDLLNAGVAAKKGDGF